MSICMINSSSSTSSPAAQHHEPSPSERKWKVEPPSADEMKEFYKSLSECSIKPVCPSLIHLYSNLFIFSTRNIKAVPNFYYKKYLELSYPDLLKECYKVDLKLLDEQLKAIERDTANQAKQSPFFQHRAWRKGASKCSAASHTDLSGPSQSLIKGICYPSMFHFTIAATEHGYKHEAQAIAAYKKTMKEIHANFVVIKCGTSIYKKYPFFAGNFRFFMWMQLLWTGLWKGEVPLLHRGAWLW